MLGAIIAALYTAVAAAFHSVTLLDGVLDFRPAAVIPLVGGIFFGPAACWGAALGGGLSDALVFEPAVAWPGAFLNGFFLAYMTWRLTEAMYLDSRRLAVYWRVVAYAIICLIAAATGAFVDGWTRDAMSNAPFIEVGLVSLFSQTLSGIVLGPPLFVALLWVVRNYGLHYRVLLGLDIERRTSGVPALLLVIGGMGGFALLACLSYLHLHSGDVQYGSNMVRYGAVPFLFCLLIGMLAA